MLAFTRTYELFLQGLRVQRYLSVLPKSLRGSHSHFKASGFPKSNLTTCFLSHVSSVMLIPGC